MPRNGLEGFLSGLAHPVIGLDHLVCIVAIGLLSATVRPGYLVAMAFILAAMGGAAIHLAGFAIPGVEPIISASVLLFGVLLVATRAPRGWLLVSLAAIAGLFHGYAYGESIFGAETGPLVAYLTGFTCVQMLVAIAAYGAGRIVLFRHREGEAGLKPAGLVVCGVGFALLCSQVLDTLLAAVARG